MTWPPAARRVGSAEASPLLSTPDAGVSTIAPEFSSGKPTEESSPAQWRSPLDGRPPVPHRRCVAHAEAETRRLSRTLSRKLSQRDWVEAAIQTLLDEGPARLQVARLARTLGVTPGSFYWHFRDRDDLRDRVLQHWRDQLLRGADAAARMANKGAEQIRALPGILVARRLPNLDAAMRAWAREDAVVARAVASADELRIRVITAMLREAGLDALRAQQRARILWWVARGSSGADESERLRAFRDTIELLLHDVR